MEYKAIKYHPPVDFSNWGELERMSKMISYETRKLNHLISNAIKMKDSDKLIRQFFRIYAQMALLVVLVPVVIKIKDTIFPKPKYYIAKNLGGDMYQIPAETTLKLLPMPKN